MTSAVHNNIYEPSVTEVLPYDAIEPEGGSVVMTQGPTGTAFQCFFSDDLWHSVSGYTKTWVELQRLAIKHKMPLILLHDSSPYLEK